MSDEQEKRDNENYAKNFTRVCNIVLDSYKHLTYEEKFLYIKMREVYWDAKPRFATLREISHLTGYAISALSRILPRLDKCGLIHAEIKQEYNPDGSKKGKPKYYISIPDIWELNRKYYECSPEERFDPSDVLQKNENVLQKNENVLQKNENVLQKNENVLQKNDVVPPEEHFLGPKASSRARSQAAKDNNKIINKTINKIESIVGETTPSPLVASATATHSLSSQSLSSEETKPKGPPQMPSVEASWPSRETAVQIVEAKKGRHYSSATRKQELAEAGKVLEMTVNGASITREQFEYAWDELASSSWWDEHGKPPMIKYLRRDDSIITILNKRNKKTVSSVQRPSQPSSASAYTLEEHKALRRMSTEERKEFLAKRREERERNKNSSAETQYA